MPNQDIGETIETILADWKENKTVGNGFLFLIRTPKHLPWIKDQGLFLEAYYMLMRGLDNYVDGDVPTPGDISPTQLMEDRIEFLEELQTNPDLEPENEYDVLLKHCLELGRRFGQDFHQETMDIYKSMLFDARRYGRLEAFPMKELDEHFFNLDITGTVRGMLKLYGEPSEKDGILWPLAVATRIYYNIRDLAEDFNVGYLNIPVEDLETFNITDKDLMETASQSGKHEFLIERYPHLDYLNNGYYESLPDSIKEWIFKESMKALELLDQHNRIVKDGNFGWTTRRLTFPIVYEKPARAYLKQVIDILN